MLKIYLDNCCCGRPFDDLSQEKINDEATAKRMPHIWLVRFLQSAIILLRPISRVVNYSMDEIKIVNPIEFMKI